jgi:hypothetical protein
MSELGFKLSVVSVALAACLAAGCRQKVESTDIRTTGVYPDIDVTADGSGSTRVQVRLKVGGPASNTFLELVGPDRLQVTGGGVTKDMDGSGYSYTATFPTDAAGPFVVAFLRGPADISAPNTTVTLPQPFTISLPTRELSRATDDLTYTWSPTSGAGDMDESIDGSCTEIILDTIPDDGAATISHDQIHAESGRASDSCTVTLTMARNQSGQVDPAFTEGGSVNARQLRSITFTSTP